MMTPRRALHRLGPLLAYLIATGLIWRFGSGALEVIARWLFFSAGLFCGFALAVIAGTLWVFLTGPSQEWFLESFVDPRRRGREPTAPPAPPDGPQGVLVSDLHIDTWPASPDGGPSERERRFLGLLEAVKADPRVDSFYLNGDLRDIPLHPNANAPEPLTLRLSGSLDREQGVLPAREEPILHSLLHLTEPKPGQTPVRRAIFQTGNHDIGVSGLRYVRPRMPSFLPPVQSVWNPSLLLQTNASGEELPRWVYIEHGHHWDHLLWLYMRFALLDVLRFGHRRREGQLLSGLQRGGKVGMGAQTIHPDGPLPPAPPPGASANHFPNDQPGFLSDLARLRYRHAARQIFRGFRDQKDMRVQTILLGHSHHPDRYVFPGGRVYINSGDWSGFTEHCAYCVLDSDGTVRGPFQWEDHAKAEFG